MKKLILVFSVITSLAVVSCNDNKSAEPEAGKMDQEPMAKPETAVDDKDVKTVAVTFASVDAGVTAFMKSLVDNYLEVKNALTNTDESAAAAAAAKMEKGIKDFDKSLLTADQKKVYDNIEADMKEHAEHIAKSKMDHQREHFIMLSKDVYDLVKAYGAGVNLYHDHCPMADNNKGAMWLSETKDIRNPYFGDKMMTCGSVEEMFQ